MLNQLSRVELNQIYAEIAARQMIEELELDETCLGKRVVIRRAKECYL